MSIRDSAKLFGPAWIALLADSDAASILGGISSGEEFGYRLIWFLLVLSIPLFIIQEASGRLGAVSNRGIGTLIRENYSRRTSILATIPIFVVDFFTYLSEYAGIAIGSVLVGINPLVGLVMFFGLHVLVIVTRNYQITEKSLILTSVILILSSLIIVAPRINSGESLVYFSSSRNYLFYLAINVGAVVTPPCMLIYQSSATATKYSSLRIDTSKKVSWLNLETVLGSIVTEIVVVIAEIVGTVLGGVDPEDPLKLGNVLGQLRFIFGVTLITAGFLTLVVVSLSSAWGVLEATNRNSYSNTIKLYVLESIPAILVILIMGSNYSTIVNFALTLLSLSPIVVALPGRLIGILVSKREIMGGYAYGKARLILYFVTIALITLGGIIGIIELA